jgi:hypothetical protein
MSQRVWLGWIYLKEEGGYELVLRALYHYKKRLRNIRRSPEIKDAPMFAQLVEGEAMKTYPLLITLSIKIGEGLQDPKILQSLQSDVPLIEKALNCYEADIRKLDADSFYSEMITDKNLAASDLPNIRPALKKLLRFG